MEIILESVKSLVLTQQLALLLFLHLIIPMIIIQLDKASFSVRKHSTQNKFAAFKESTGVFGNSSVRDFKKETVGKSDIENIEKHKQADDGFENDSNLKIKLNTEFERLYVGADNKNTNSIENQEYYCNFDNIDAINDYIAKSSNAKAESQPFIRNNPRMLKVNRGIKKYANRGSFISFGSSGQKQKKHFGTNTSIYIIQSPFKTNSGFEVKVGESTNFDNRVKTYRQYWKNLFNVVVKFDGTVSDEKYIQDLLRQFHISGEFYDLSSIQITAIRNMKTLSEFEDYFLKK